MAGAKLFRNGRSRAVRLPREFRFVLDTNTCIYALKLEGGVVERLKDHSPADLGVTIITVDLKAEDWL